jgi:uncharacterized protein (DUF2164 family)
MDAEKGQFDTDFLLNFISKEMGKSLHIKGNKQSLACHFNVWVAMRRSVLTF